MGFDNECILNIQSLPGEYFCPVCRLLVYPNEALQSQCTHLYCKPCLTYVAGTTRACPYDGYLVTEADSKPLVESNKALAETIGKITVHCLYNKSGCTWQGSFSECSVHCSGCAFGNSPVVCNRCSLQIVHRQVLEHAQNCPGVPVQGQVEGAQNAAAIGTSDAVNQTSQAGTIMSQGQTSQTSTTTTSGLDPSQQTNSNTQAVTQATLMTSEQWYQQHQQQYQQYYQQYPGYDPYYQQYYQQQLQAQAPQMAGQQQVYIQSQAQTQPLLQPQPQIQPLVQSQPQPQALQPQPIPSVQALVVTQSQQALGNPMQQLQPVLPPQSRAPSQTLPPAQSQPHIQVQPYLQAQPQVQPQFPLLQHPAPQSQPHLQVQPQTLAQPQSQPYSKVQPSPNQPLNPNFQPQTQHPSVNAVTGQQSYQQPQTYQHMSVGGPQQPVHMNSQGGLHPQLQPPAQMQSSYPQQPPQMRPPQSHAATPNQHTPPMLPSPVPLQPVITHGQQLPAIPVNQQPGMLPAQSSLTQQYVQQQPLPLSGQSVTSVQNQTHQKGPLLQHQLPIQPHQRPKGSHHSSQKFSHAYLQPQQNLVLSQSMHPRPSLNLPGRPVVPTSGVQSQQYQQSAAGIEVKQAQFGNQPSSGQNNMPGPNGASDVGAGAGETKVLKSETNLRPMEEKTGVDGTDMSTKEMNESKNTLGSDLESKTPELGDNFPKKPAKEEPTEDQKDVIIEHRKLPSSVLEEKNAKDGPLRSNPPLQKDKVLSQGQGAPKGPGSNEFRGFSQGRGYPVGNLQHPSLHQYTVNNPQQRPAVPGMLQGSGSPLHAQTQSLLPGQLRPQVPGRAALPGKPLVPPENLHLVPVGKASYGPESQFGQHFMDGRRPDPSAQSNSMMRMNRPLGLDSSPAFGVRDDILKFGKDERLNPLDKGPRGFGRGQFVEDLKQFPRSSHFDVDPVTKFGSHFSSANLLDKGPRGLGMDVGPGPREKGPHGLPYDPMVGSGPSRFLPPHHSSGRLPPDDTVERPVGFHEDTLGRPDFNGPIPGYSRQNMDGFASRSPGREYLGMPHGFGSLHGDDIGGRENRFNDRFSDLRSHSRNGEFGGPNNMPMGEHFRSGDLIGQNIVPSHLRRGEHLGPLNLRFGEAGGFGHERIGEFGGPGNFRHPQLGEPGFRSSFSHHGFSSDGSSYTGNMDHFDRRRKPPSMGWCRICKVDCETVEGLDIHSQSREHQKNAMDMVAIIKQNAKRQKITPGDRPFHNDSSKSRHSNFEGRAIKH